MTDASDLARSNHVYSIRVRGPDMDARRRPLDICRRRERLATMRVSLCDVMLGLVAGRPSVRVETRVSVVTRRRRCVVRL